MLLFVYEHLKLKIINNLDGAPQIHKGSGSPSWMY